MSYQRHEAIGCLNDLLEATDRESMLPDMLKRDSERFINRTADLIALVVPYKQHRAFFDLLTKRIKEQRAAKKQTTP